MLASGARGPQARRTHAHCDSEALEPEQVGLLRLLASGATEEAVARSLGVSTRTLRRRMSVICRRVGARSVIEAAVWAARRNLI